MLPGRLASLVRERGDLLSRMLLAALQAAAVAWFSPGRGLPLDDAWIHQVVARTFAETGTLGYAPGQHGAAATSYLWAALLAVDFKLLHVDPSRWALFLNGASALAVGQLLYALLVRARPSDVEGGAWRATSFVATLLACVSPNILWFTCSGMEAMPFVALSLGAIWAATDEQTRRSRALVAGVTAGALALLRPEAAPLGGLLAAHALARRRTRSFLPIAAPWVLSVLVYVASNLVATGHALPSTLSGRRWLWFEMSRGRSRLDLGLDFLDAWAARLGTYTLDTSLGLLWILAAVAAFGALRLVRSKLTDSRGDGVKLLFAWTLFHAAFYLLLLPTPGHGGRYQPLTPLLFAVCLPLGATLLLRDVARIAGLPNRVQFAWFALAGFAPWIALSGPVARSLREANALAVAHIQATEMAAGAFVGELPEGAVASFDIGGAGYASERRVLDLGGLSDPSTASLLEEGRISTWLERNHVRWVVLPQSYEPVLPVFEDYGARLHLRDNPALTLEPVRVFETPFDKWVPSIRATWNAAPKQVVYEVRYTGRPGPLERPKLPADARRAISDPAEIAPRRARVVTEHMLATLAAWDVPVDVRVTGAAPTSDDAPAACTITMGWWGFDAKGCASVGDAALLRAMTYEQAGRYLDVGDLGGALRAIPHVIAQARRRADPRFHPPIAPLMPPMPGGDADGPMGAARFGLALFAIALLSALGIDAAARRGARATRLVSTLRARTTGATALTLLTFAIATTSACASDTDVASAVSRGRGAVAIALDHGGSPDGARGRPPLLEAAAAGDADTVALLLAHGADVDVRAPDEATALHLAARRGHHAAATVVAAAMTKAAHCTGCAIDYRELAARLDAPAGPRRRTALHDAVLAGSVDTVTTLLAAGAAPDALDAFGQSPLHLVALVDPARSEAIARALLVARADPSLLDARGFTALSAAAVADNAPVVRLLAERASLLSAKSPVGETAIDLARRYGRDRAVETLLRAGAVSTDAEAWPPLHDAARVDSVERVASLLSMGADPLRRFRNKAPIDVAILYRSKRVEAILRERLR